jgi:hypothetical protein
MKMPGDRDRALPRRGIGVKAADRKAGPVLCFQADRKLVGGIRIAAHEAQRDCRISGQWVCSLAKRNHETPLLDDQTPRHVEGRPDAAERERTADRSEHETHESHGDPSPAAHLAVVRHRDDAGHAREDEDAGREEWQAKRRHAASALADLQAIGRDLLEWSSHVLTIGCSIPNAQRPTPNHSQIPTPNSQRDSEV